MIKYLVGGVNSFFTYELGNRFGHKEALDNIFFFPNIFATSRTFRVQRFRYGTCHVTLLTSQSPKVKQLRALVERVTSDFKCF